MKIKRLIYVMMSNKIQVFIERRRNFEVNRWDGEVAHSINTEGNGSIETETLEDCWQEFVHEDEYVSALMLVEKSSPTMEKMRAILGDAICKHNANIENNSICEWTEEDIQKIMNVYEGTLLFNEGEIVDDTIIHSTGIVQITTSEGSTYVIPKPVVLDTNEASVTIKSDQDSNEKVGPIVSEEHRRERKKKKKHKNKEEVQKTIVKGVPEVSFADTTPAPTEETTDVSNKVKSKKNDKTEDIGKKWGKEKASSKDIAGYMAEATKDFNHDVRAPK
ncbi:hypothetical protein [Veillonella sp. 3891]|uniref:hypothetical protein n=1 Tax=Veillonella sp. 3891 TaxID=2490951 RepID=UPI000F8D3840|nr:hypothetical protein [Veillonella sp. 3891]